MHNSKSLKNNTLKRCLVWVQCADDSILCKWCQGAWWLLGCSAWWEILKFWNDMGVLGFQVAKVAFEVRIGLHFLLHTVQERLHYTQHHVEIPKLSANCASTCKLDLPFLCWMSRQKQCTQLRKPITPECDAASSLQQHCLCAAQWQTRCTNTRLRGTAITPCSRNSCWQPATVQVRTEQLRFFATLFQHDLPFIQSHSIKCKSLLAHYNCPEHVPPAWRHSFNHCCVIQSSQHKHQADF